MLSRKGEKDLRKRKFGEERLTKAGASPVTVARRVHTEEGGRTWKKRDDVWSSLLRGVPFGIDMLRDVSFS